MELSFTCRSKQQIWFDKEYWTCSHQLYLWKHICLCLNAYTGNYDTQYDETMVMWQFQSMLWCFHYFFSHEWSWVSDLHWEPNAMVSQLQDVSDRLAYRYTMCPQTSFNLWCTPYVRVDLPPFTFNFPLREHPRTPLSTIHSDKTAPHCDIFFGTLWTYL